MRKTAQKKKQLILIVANVILAIAATGIWGTLYREHREHISEYKKMNEELELFEFKVDAEMYPDLEQYVFINDYDFFYTYGTDMEDYMVENSVYEFLLYMPKTLKRFVEEDGRIIISNEQFLDTVKALTDVEYDEQLGGIYFRDPLNENKPTICINYRWYASEEILSFFVWGDTEHHEMAHYMDDIYDFSSTKEFKEYFSRYAKDYEPRCNVEEGYQAKSEKEFFAVLVTDILMISDIEFLNIPEDLCEYMKEALMEAEGIDIFQ